MDVSMPRLNGADTTRRMLASRPGIGVIAFSSYDEPFYIREMLHAGAGG